MTEGVGESVERWTRMSFALTPALAASGVLAWFVPLTSAQAPGHALYVVVFVHIPFLLLLMVAMVVTAFLVRRRVPRSSAQWRALARLQLLLVAVLVLGAIPVLAFDLDPNGTLAAGSVLHPLFAVSAVAAVVLEWVLLARAAPAGRFADPGEAND